MFFSCARTQLYATIIQSHYFTCSRRCSARAKEKAIIELRKILEQCQSNKSVGLIFDKSEDVQIKDWKSDGYDIAGIFEETKKIDLEKLEFNAPTEIKCEEAIARALHPRQHTPQKNTRQAPKVNMGRRCGF